jgi:hypothetical protein
MHIYIYIYIYICIYIHIHAVSGLITMSDPLEKGFCVYGSTKGCVYQPLSVMRQFYQKHGLALAKDPVFIAEASVSICVCICVCVYMCVCVCISLCL